MAEYDKRYKEFPMKKLIWLQVLLGIICFAGLLASCSDDDDDDSGSGSQTPAVYNGFYEYPTGRVSASGTLTVQNQSASEVLLFNGTVEGANYLGTVGSLGSVQLKLSEEKFYSVVAVDKSVYEEKTTNAAQTSYFTYYSNSQAYKINVSTSASSGSGTWLINNPTSYWVRFEKSDGSQNLAVVAPGGLRVAVPIEIDRAYDYKVFFTKEVKLNGKIISVVETTDTELYGTAVAKSANSYLYSTTVGTDVKPSSSLKPSLMIKNEYGGTVYCKKSSIYLNNGSGAATDNLPVISGETMVYVGLSEGDSLNTINFENVAWTAGNKGNLYLSDDTKMENGKVYVITLSGSNSSDRAVTLTSVSDADEVFTE